LEQAAAYVEATACTLTDYVDLFRTCREKLWENEKPPLAYSKTVTTTWAMAMDHLQEEEPAAADLLNLLAFLAPDDIPRDLFAKGAEHLPDSLAEVVKDELALNRAIAALRHYSLITADDDSLSLHRLVQAVTRDRLPEEGRRTSAGVALRLMAVAFPFRPDDPATWEESGRLLPHALAAAGHAADAEVELNAAGRTLNNAALYLRLRAEFAAAKAVCERNLAITETAYGAEHPNMAAAINNLGSVLRQMGDLKGAKEHYERALAIDEKAYGPDHPNVARDVNNLGSVLRDMGDLAEARQRFERALAIDERAFGPDHPAVAIRVNNLGSVLRAMGDLMGAKKHFERALAVDEKAYGPDHPEVATAANNLGLVLKDLGDLEGAKKHFERALAIDEKTYGPDHPDVATAANNLGGVLRDMGDLDRAKEHFERALAIFRKFLGEDHPTTQLVRGNLEALGKARGS